MRVDTPQIFWHGNRDRIMSIDFYPNTNFLVTCGAESENKMWIKLWEIEDSQTNDQSQMQIDDQPRVNPKFLNDLSGAHTSTVNVVRFSPNGMYLASGADDSSIIIWVQKSRPIAFNSLEEKVTWSNQKILRGHLGDVYDLAWSPDSKYIISGSVDNTAIVWNLEKSKGIQKLIDHVHFVQGVSWDPRNKYIVTQSSDKSAKIYKNSSSKQEIKFFYLNQLRRYEKSERQQQDSIEVIPNTTTTTQPQQSKTQQNSAFHYYFADETQCPSFFRRHAWSPDGAICLLVSGMNNESSNEIDHVIWGVSRKNFSKPLFYIPTLDSSAICIRFCPIIFGKSNNNNDDTPALLDLPYQMIFAIGTSDSVFIYSTQSIKPRFAITNIHFLSITDLAWKGATMLAISSSDGYITFCSFEKEELGKPIDPELIVDEKLKASYEEYLSIDIAKNVISSTMIASVIKPKRKKEKEGSSPINNEEPIKNIEDCDSIMRIDNTNTINQVNMNSQMQMDIDDNTNNLPVSNSNMITSNPQPSSNILNNNNNNSEISSSGKRRITPTLIL